jgi:hypothetical protein
MALAVCYVRGGQDDAAERQVKEFIGSGDHDRFAFWKRWVSRVAGQARPSLTFFFARAVALAEKECRWPQECKRNSRRRSESMKNARELERRIVTELQDLRGLESRLDQRFTRLEEASPKTRASFLKGLLDLKKRTRGVEQLIDTLANDAYQTASASV